MARYIAWRAIQTIPLLIGIVVLVFLLVHLAPGDPTAALAGDRADLEYQQRLRERLGLDQPLAVQLGLYLGTVARGDLGYSFTYREPVLDLILDRLPPTLLLMSVAFVLSAFIGIWVGTWTAARRGSRRWGAVGVAAVAGYSIPSFWLAIILVLFFGAYLRWFPIVGMTSLTSRATDPLSVGLDIAHHMVLPVLTLTVYYVALISRLTRSSMNDTLHQDYILAARGKGLSERDVVYRHALRNALLPVVTVLGLQFGAMIAGFVVVEVVFAWPGLGRLTYDAILARDYPVVMGLFIILSIAVILANLLTDVLYAFIDPRIRYA